VSIPASNPGGSSRRTGLFVGLGVLALGLLVVVTVLLLRGGDDEAVDDAPPPDDEPEGEEPDPGPDASTWPLTGLPIDDADADDTERPAMLVKVSNSPEARPQTGLDRADLVYEELVEGGVTRYMAVFHSDLPEVVGPVRSARPVDTQLLAGFGAPGFLYSGAREEVRSLLAASPGAVLTEGIPVFFRDDGTYASTPVAPHDLFVRVAEARSVAEDDGAAAFAGLGWRFDEQPPDGEEAGASDEAGETDEADEGDDGGTEADGTAIDIAMSQFFTTSWSYDEGAGVYRRSQDGTPSEVTGEGRIGAANVVVLAVRHYVGDSGFPETDVLGEGDALVLRDGRRYAATWSKPTASAPLELLTVDGEPFPLAPGRTWIHLPDELP
jgi:hypothetical protein